MTNTYVISSEKYVPEKMHYSFSQGNVEVWVNPKDYHGAQTYYFATLGMANDWLEQNADKFCAIRIWEKVSHEYSWHTH